MFAGYLILHSREGSGYADSPDQYEFPARYLKHFDPAGGQVAVIYEPTRASGRKAFVGWCRIASGPEKHASGKYTVPFTSPIVSFDRPIPLSLNGIAVLHRLRKIPRVHWGRAMQGQAVEALPAENAIELLTLGANASIIEQNFDAGLEPEVPAVERASRLVAVVERQAGFRDHVLKQHGFRCVITGLETSAAPASRLGGLIEAAHVKPVSDGGPDDVSNGVTLTPTVHRMFDAGLFTLVAEDASIRIRVSPKLHPSMVTSASGAHLPIEDGRPVEIAVGAVSRAFLLHHQRRVFKAG